MSSDFDSVKRQPRSGALERVSGMANFAPMWDVPGASDGSTFNPGELPQSAEAPMDAAAALELLESAYDAADANLTAAIDNLSRLRYPSVIILGAQGAARWMRVQIILLSSESFASVFFLFASGMRKCPYFELFCAACH